MSKWNRRNFIQVSAAASTVFSAPLIKSGFAKNSPNDTINIGTIGLHGRGTAHLKTWWRIPNVRIAAICDVDENLFFNSTEMVQNKDGQDPATYTDVRKLLENKDIDAISVASPDHWHGLMTIWGCQAGKDVYVEKPLSYSILEGRKMIQAARKYNRIVQMGNQDTSNIVENKAIELVHNGALGEVYMGKSVVYNHRPSIGRKPDTAVPQGVNWDLFLGPAPMKPFNENRYFYNWHWQWDTSTTEFGNSGSYWLELVRRAMKKHEHPVDVDCFGGKYCDDSDQEVPNTQIANMQYADGKHLQIEVRNLFSNQEGHEEARHAMLYGSKGWMYIGTGRFGIFYGPNNEPGPAMEEKNLPAGERKEMGGIHFTNFIDCMRSRKWQDLHCDVEVSHYGTVTGHLGNIAYRVGRRLKFDSAKERFINDPEADKYLTRESYRAPYLLPDQV